MLTTLEAAITERTARRAGFALLALFVLVTLTWLATSRGLLDRFGQPVGGDFILFYSASRLTLAGHAAAAYDPHALFAVQQAVIAGVRPGLEWCYPPPFQLIFAPLAALPFPLAYGVFVSLGLIPFLALARRLAPGPGAVMAALALPATFVTAWQGQNGLFVAAVLGWGLLLLESRPWLAGAILGLLVCKPQFALVLPFALIGGRHWRSLVAAGASGAILCLASAAILGLDAWRAFFASLPGVSQALALGQIPWVKLDSVFVALRMAGLGVSPALAVQTVASLAVGAVVLVFWRRAGPTEAKTGLAAAAALLMTPYVFNYDLALLAIPLAASLAMARESPLPAGGKLILILAVLAPMLFLTLAKATGLQLAPASLLALFLLLVVQMRQARPAERAALHPGASPRLV